MSDRIHPVRCSYSRRRHRDLTPFVRLRERRCWRGTVRRLRITLNSALRHGPPVRGQRAQLGVDSNSALFFISLLSCWLRMSLPTAGDRPLIVTTSSSAAIGSCASTRLDPLSGRVSILGFRGGTFLDGFEGAGTGRPCDDRILIGPDQYRAWAQPFGSIASGVGIGDAHCPCDSPFCLSGSPGRRDRESLTTIAGGEGKEERVAILMPLSTGERTRSPTLDDEPMSWLFSSRRR